MTDFCLLWICLHKIFGDYCTMKLRFVDIFGFGCKSTFWAFHLLVLLFRLYNPRKLFSWQTVHDQTMNNLDFAVCETTCVNIKYPSADCRHAWPKISITSMRKFADFTLYILKCRVGPSFIHLVMSAMFIWTYSFVSYSTNSIFLVWSACVTLKREFLSCQFQFSLRTSTKIVS